jgi:hypothetical protein
MAYSKFSGGHVLAAVEPIAGPANIVVEKVGVAVTLQVSWP